MRRPKMVLATVAAICSVFFLSGLAYADRVDRLADFSGQYACSFEVYDEPLGPQAAISDLRIRPRGSVKSFTKATTYLDRTTGAHEIDCIGKGKVTRVRGNRITVKTVGECTTAGGVELPPIDQVNQCLGSLRGSNGYEALTCLDLTDEGASTGVPEIQAISLVHCNRVDLQGRDNDDDDDDDDDHDDDD